MSKTSLQAAMADFKRTVTNYNNEAEALRKSPAYTEQGKAEKLGELAATYKGHFTAISSKLHVEFSAALEAAQKDRGARIQSRIKDGGYQIGLQNAVEAIKSGAAMSKGDLKAIAQSFEGDPFAASLLRGALSESGRHELVDLIPEDKGAAAMSALEGISEKLRTMARNAETGIAINNYSLAAVDVYSKNLDNYFNEDFELI